MAQAFGLVNSKYHALLRSLDEALARAEAEKAIDRTTRELIMETITGVHSAVMIQARKLLEALEFAERILLLLCSRCPRFTVGQCPGRTGWVAPRPSECPHAGTLDAIYDAIQDIIWDAMDDLAKWIRERW